MKLKRKSRFISVRAGRLLTVPLLCTVFASLAPSGCVMVSDKLLGDDSGAAAVPPEVTPAAASAGRFAPDWERYQPLELHGALLSYADRYMEGVAQAVDEVIERGIDPGVRSLLLGTKVVYISSAFTVAAEPNPGASLLDMMVMVSLQRVVWEEAWGEFIGGENAEVMSEALKALEKDIFRLAAKAMTDEQVAILRELIAAWRRENPGQRYVAYVRFEDFAPSLLKDRFSEEVSRGGGLLAPVKEAVKEVEEVKMIAERGIFLANHFPILMEWHMDYLLSKVAISPEVSGLLEDSRRLSEAGGNLAATVKGLPDRLAKERADLLEDLAVRVAEERRRTLEQLVETVRGQREELLQDLREGDEELASLLGKIESAGTVLRDTAQSLERLFGADEPKAVEEEAEGPTGLEALDVTLGNITTAAVELNVLVKQLESLMSSEATASALDAVDARLRTHEKRLFLFGAGLILLFFLGLIAFAVTTKALRSSV